MTAGRREDARLLQGTACFVDDVHRDRMVHGVFIRSPMAHARITGIDVGAALRGGALLVLTAKDLPFIDRTFLLRQTSAHIRGGWARFLASDRARYVGEPVAFLVARDRYEAEDLAELVEIAYEPLAPIGTVDAALAEDAELLHGDWPGNVAARFERRTGEPDAAMNAAPHRLKRRYAYGRQIPLPLETRGCVADFDPGRERVTLWTSTQTHYQVQQNIAAMLALPESQVRVIAQDVGGGFGSKSRPYAEDIIVSHASRLLRRPVKWIEDRFEHLVATTHSRSVDTELEVGFDSNGKLLALRAAITADIGAYVFSSGIITSEMAAAALAGPYRIPAMSAVVTCVGTNKTPLATYRGAGQPEGTFPLEATLDLIARHLDLPAAEVRRRNLITPEDFPYPVWAPRDGTGEVESGDFPAVHEQTLRASGYSETPVTLPSGERAAWGMACGLELTGSTSFESAKVRACADGTVVVLSGMSSQGQGQASSYAQVCAQVLGIAPEQITVDMGDTSLLPFGRGAFGSRGAVVGANAVAGAARRLVQKALATAARIHACAPEELEFTNATVIHKHQRHAPLTLAQLATATAPGGIAFDGDIALEAEFVFDTRGRHTYALSIHAARVAVDPASGFVRVIDYYVAHDCGRPLVPALVEGQVLGGVAEGIGCALLSEMPYDTNGQPLAGTLADYLVATATEIPRIRIDHLETHAATNPLGIRGIGEAGTIPAAPAIVNAIARAISPQGCEFQDALLRLPVRPAAVRQAYLKASALMPDGYGQHSNGIGPN